MAKSWLEQVGLGVGNFANNVAQGFNQTFNGGGGGGMPSYQRNSPYEYFDALSRYQNSMQPQAPSFQNGMMAYGMNTAQNLGGQVMNGFAQAAALNSQNLQNRMQYESQLQLEKMRQEGQNQRMSAAAPLLSALLGGNSGSGSGSNGSSVTTNYGAGYGNGQPNPQRISNEALQGIQSNLRQSNQAARLHPGPMKPFSAYTAFRGSR